MCNFFDPVNVFKLGDVLPVCDKQIFNVRFALTFESRVALMYRLKTFVVKCGGQLYAAGSTREETLQSISLVFNR